MKTKHSRSKRLISSMLAFLVLFNTACGVHRERPANREGSSSLRSFQTVVNYARGEVNTVEPDNYRVIRINTEHELHDFSYSDEPSFENDTDNTRPTSLPGIYSELFRDGNLIEQHREYLAGHAERMTELREACQMVSCNGIESVDDGNLNGFRTWVRDNKLDSDTHSAATPKTRNELIEQLERMELELQNEKQQWEQVKLQTQERKRAAEIEFNQLIESVRQAIEHSTGTAFEQNKNARKVRDELIAAHNAGIEKVYAALGTDPTQGVSSADVSDEYPLSPSAQAVSRFQEANKILRTTAQIPALNDGAETFAELARVSAERGDLSSYDRRMNAARTFAWASQLKRPHDESTLGAAIDLSSSAKILNAQGLTGLADVSVSLAKHLVHVALDLARINSLVDIPLSILEAFTGKTVDLEDNGEPFLRDCSPLERGFAVGTLAIGTIAVASTSAPLFAAAIAVGGGGKLLKAFKEQAILKKGAEAGLHLYDETIAVAKDIDRKTPGLMFDGLLSARAKNHIVNGEIRISKDKVNVRIDGGLHTQGGLKNYLAQAPIQNAPVSREMLPNGVERVVFPDAALTRREIGKLSKAAQYGFGVANGKTLFPEHWSPEKIEMVIQKALNDGEIFSKSDKGFRKLIKHEDVTVIVNIDTQGKVKSAFPRWEQ